MQKSEGKARHKDKCSRRGEVGGGPWAHKLSSPSSGHCHGHMQMTRRRRRQRAKAKKGVQLPPFFRGEKGPHLSNLPFPCRRRRCRRPEKKKKRNFPARRRGAFPILRRRLPLACLLCVVPPHSFSDDDVTALLSLSHSQPSPNPRVRTCVQM